MFDIVAPYKDWQAADMTGEMQREKFTPKKLLAESFFVSRNMSALPKSFWRNSIIENGRETVCHASAWMMMSESSSAHVCRWKV